MRHLTLISAAVLCFVSLAGAAEAPDTKAGRTAIERYSAARQKLDSDYAAKVNALNQKLAVDLESAIKVATRNGDLQDANALQAFLDSIVGRRATFRIDAAKDWQPTVHARKGQKISIRAEGEWSAGADERYQHLSADGLDNAGYLECSVAGKTFRIGSEGTIEIEADGIVQMRMADPGGRSDNSGEIIVVLTH